MKEKKKLTLGGIFSQIVLLMLYPLAFMFLTSVKSNLDVLTNPFGITTFKPENYVSAWKIGKIGSFFMNSVIITIMTLAVQLIVIILASFALGKLRPWGSGFIEILFLSGLFITSEMLTITNFTTLKAWGLNGTRLALLLPYVTLGLPTAIFIMINYVKGLPKELDEAALLDGCSLLQNLFRITLPLLKPVIATVMIFNFQGTWSEFYWALIEIKKDSLKTLPLGLMNFNSMYNTDYGVLCAGLCIATIPVVLLYLKCSSYFIGGMVVKAFLRFCAYQYIIKDLKIPADIMECLYKEVAKKNITDEISEMALLSYFAGCGGRFSAEQKEWIRNTVRHFIDSSKILPLFKEFASFVTLPDDMKFKTYLIFKGESGRQIWVSYSFGQESNSMAHYKSERMNEIIPGIYIKEFVVFHGETLLYSIDGAESGNSSINSMLISQETRNDQELIQAMDTYLNNTHFFEENLILL